EIGGQEPENAVRLQDRVLTLGQLATNRGHGFRQTSLLRPHPPGARSPGGQKTRCIRFSGAVLLLRDCPAVIIGRAVTCLAISGAHTVPVLSDLERRPVVLP